MHHRLRLAVIIALAVLVAPACSRTRQYELKGQVLSVDRARQEITIKHDDIRGFMPGMTMPFKVKDATLLDLFGPGDLVTATLVVGSDEAHLSSITRTGHTQVAAADAAATPPHVLEPGEAVPDVALVDENGRARRLSDWTGKTVAVTFVYTRCPLPEFCPRMDRNFGAVQRDAMGDARLRDRVHLLSLSFDPDYDTPAVLREHARRVGADTEMWTYATGEREAVDAFAKNLGMSIFREDPEKVEIVHNLRTAVIRGDGRLATIFNGNDWTSADLLAALKDASDVRR